MAKYYVTIKCNIQEDDPRQIVEDILSEIGCCWHTLNDLAIIVQSEIQEHNNLPESYSCKSEILVWTENGYARISGGDRDGTT